MQKQKSKRAVADVPIFLDRQLFTDLQAIVEAIQWPYATRRGDYWQRDQALACCLILTGARVSEALAIRALQVRDYSDRLVIANVATLKHGLLRSKIICPKRGGFAWFTEKLAKWFTDTKFLAKIPKEQFLFPRGSPNGFLWDKPLGRKRAFWILKTTVDRFPHWFRGVNATIYGRLIFRNDAWKLKEFMGWRRLGSSSPYVKGSWEDDIDEIYKI